MRPGAPPLPIGEHPAPSDDASPRWVSEGVVAWVREGEGAAYWEAGDVGDGRLYVGARLGPGGVEALRGVELDNLAFSRPRALARVGGRWGVVFDIDPVESPVFFPMEGSGRLPEQMPSFTWNSVPCQGASDPQADLMARRHPPGYADVEGAASVVDLERAGDAWCVRSAGLSGERSPANNPVAVHGRVTAAGDGTLRGRLVDADGVFTHVCR